MPLTSTNSELRITPERAKAMVEGGQALFLDVVSSSVYPMMHKAIAGAMRIAPEELAAQVDHDHHLLHLTQRGNQRPGGAHAAR